MKLFGLQFPRFTHYQAIGGIASATATVVGFGTGSWALGAPLDRESALALFVGFLYIAWADPFLSMTDAKAKRYALTACGAGMLVASASVLEQLNRIP